MPRVRDTKRRRAILRHCAFVAIDDVGGMLIKPRRRPMVRLSPWDVAMLREALAPRAAAETVVLQP